jgi:antirestriction protein ArdC
MQIQTANAARRVCTSIERPPTVILLLVETTRRTRLEARFGTREYAAEELVAELGAVFLCAEFGFADDIRNASYIATWIDLLRRASGHSSRRAAGEPKAADYLRGLAPAEPAAAAA